MYWENRRIVLCKGSCRQAAFMQQNTPSYYCGDINQQIFCVTVNIDRNSYLLG